ncbi:hypothetical protein GOODEAATRI_028520, partial [Goodea atripinnis]
LQATSAVYRLQLLERSDLPKTLLLSMAALQNQPSIKLQLLQTLQLLSSASDMNCTLILDAGGAEMICLHMNEGERSGQVLLCSLEILWNLLESRSKEEAMTQLSSMECVVEELVMVNLLQLVNPPVAYPEHRPASPHCFITQQEELQLQALDGLASIAPVMLHDYMSCQGNTCLLLLLERCTNKGPLQFLHYKNGNIFTSFYACIFILTLVSICRFQFIFLCTVTGLVFCLLISDARVSRMAQMQRCIRVLRSVTALGDPAVNQDLCDQGAINQLLGNFCLNWRKVFEMFTVSSVVQSEACGMSPSQGF